MMEQGRPTGKVLTTEQGISAYMTLKRFCREQQCNECMFRDENVQGPFPCMFRKGNYPLKWPDMGNRQAD